MAEPNPNLLHVPVKIRPIHELIPAFKKWFDQTHPTCHKCGKPLVWDQQGAYEDNLAGDHLAIFVCECKTLFHFPLRYIHFKAKFASVSQKFGLQLPLFDRIVQ